MFSVLLESRRQRPRMAIGGAVSAGVHLLVLAAGVAVTAREEALPAVESFITRALFRPPPDRIMSLLPRGERLQWLSLGIAPGGLDGFTDLPLGQSVTGRPAIDPNAGLADGDAAEPVSPSPLVFGNDTAFSVLEVDSAAARYVDSDAPVYPLTLLERQIQGAVYMRYVIDTTGAADTVTALVLRSTHPEFTRAVLAALPRMRFRPAMMGSRRVRQLVEQEFAFRINPPGTGQIGPPPPISP